MKTDSLKEPLMKTKQTKSHGEIKKTFKYQALMFILCYLTWVGVHTQRAYWSMSKSVMADQNPNLSMSFFAKIDTALFQALVSSSLVQSEMPTKRGKYWPYL